MQPVASQAPDPRVRRHRGTSGCRAAAFVDTAARVCCFFVQGSGCSLCVRLIAVPAGCGGIDRGCMRLSCDDRCTIYA